MITGFSGSQSSRDFQETGLWFKILEVRRWIGWSCFGCEGFSLGSLVLLPG